MGVGHRQLCEIAEDAVAVTGAACPSDYGTEVTAAIVADVSDRGMAIAGTGGPSLDAHTLTTARRAGARRPRGR